jgi:hypothetical protein
MALEKDGKISWTDCVKNDEVGFHVESMKKGIAYIK